MKKIINKYKVEIKELDKKDFTEIPGTRRTVYTGDLNPSLEIAFQNRPNDSKIDWAKKIKEIQDDSKS